MDNLWCERLCVSCHLRSQTSASHTWGLNMEERNLEVCLTLLGVKDFFGKHATLHFLRVFYYHVHFMWICTCASYLSILCNLLGVMPLPLSVKVRHSWPSSSTTSIQICLADTPGSDALSTAQDLVNELKIAKREKILVILPSVQEITFFKGYGNILPTHTLHTLYTIRYALLYFTLVLSND